MTDQSVIIREAIVPSKTFENIPFEKRERILISAAALFAERGFAKTDVAGIADLAGVAKGSIYNYFKNKEDLYLSVCRDGLERSRAAIYGGMNSGWDIYGQVEHIFKKGMEFSLAHPEYIRLYINISSAGMEGFADTLTLEVEKYTADHLKQAIRKGIRSRIVRPDIDPNQAAFFINSLYIMFVVSLISRHFQIRLREYLEIEGDIDAGNMYPHVESAIRLIHGFLKPGNQAADSKNREEVSEHDRW